MNKKGMYTVSALGALAITLVIAAIVVAIGANLLADIQDKVSTTGVTKTNQTGYTLTNNTVVAFQDKGVCGFSDVAVTDINNATCSIGTSNYSYTINGIKVISNLKLINTDAIYNVSYTYTQGEYACNATKGGLAGTEQFGSWLDTIALIIVAAVVIGIIASSFGNKQ